ncbi:putative lipid II flippase MurJ [Hyella patelloides LEGE 07179]|uniref:Probable lipid II flippase MurJ n=1 Tax=Hyella patelloides LEGE 07179 TaxID=945734 RepID=A0A563VNQ8_9CYAN|nr:murein biosynthesis integral membrane protein MurJ [Hyella patelloides]VEP13061.1 putative lipid II flippase MurJ [Hyella patelloides LEGE 07179]
MSNIDRSSASMTSINVFIVLVSVNNKSSRSLANIAGIVAVATLVSKLFGLVREQIIAAAFGVGTVVNAYAYAYVIPGFLLILLGGINGPFHSALISVLAKRDKSEAAPIVETVTTLVTVILLVVTVVLVVFAGTFIDLLAPGLDTEVRQIAILQLQIMSPVAMLAGLIGIGFGTLNAADSYFLPSISPLFSSITIVVIMGCLLLQIGDKINTPQYLTTGAIALAGATLAGAILQWLAQLIVQWRTGMGKLRLRFDWRIPGVMDVLKVMAPATLSSGMLQINVYTDLFFASFIPGAAAAMRYGNFIALTPLGIISNTILVPFLPVFSRLAAPENWSELKVRIRQGLFLTALTMLPLTAIFISLALPIVKLVYERSQFDDNAARQVAPLLMAYGLGLLFYLARDVLVRVFYALGDGETPFRISIINIFLNAILDFLLVNAFAAPGLVMATIGVNIVSMVIFLWLLNKRLNGLPLGQWSKSLFGLLIATVLASGASYGVSYVWQQYLGNNGLLLLFQLVVASLVAVIVFFVAILPLRLPEVAMLLGKIKQKLGRS